MPEPGKSQLCSQVSRQHTFLPAVDLLPTHDPLNPIRLFSGECPVKGGIQAQTRLQLRVLWGKNAKCIPSSPWVLTAPGRERSEGQRDERLTLRRHQQEDVDFIPTTQEATCLVCAISTGGSQGKAGSRPGMTTLGKSLHCSLRLLSICKMRG